MKLLVTQSRVGSGLVATGLTTVVTACLLAGSPAVAAPAVTAAPGFVSLQSKAKPAFRSSDARLGAANSGSVRNLQRALIKKRYATKALKRAGATGNYLKATRSSVKRAQRKMGFSGKGADGIVGKSSATRLGLRWIAVESAVAAPKKTTSPVVATPPAGLTKATFPGGSGRLSGAQLKNVIKSAGFSGSAVCQAWGIAMRESGGYPGIMSAMNSNKTYDHGLFQINDVHRANISFESIYSAQYNANYAFTLSSRGTNFSHWGIGESGWAADLKKQNKAYWQMLQDIAANYTTQCNQLG